VTTATSNFGCPSARLTEVRLGPRSTTFDSWHVSPTLGVILSSLDKTRPKIRYTPTILLNRASYCRYE